MERVYEPAYVALCAIMKNTTITIPLPANKSPRIMPLASRKALAAKFRAYWSKYKSMPLAERWYTTLRDDDARPLEWFEAAANITQPATMTRETNLFYHWESFGSDFDISQGMLGEPLRAKSNPSVSDLFVMRFKQLLPLAELENTVSVEKSGDSGTNRLINYANMGNLLHALIAWDGKARMEDIKALTQQLNAKFPRVDKTYPSSDETNSKLFEKRAALGDPAALPEYADWVESLKPESSRNGYELDGYATMVFPTLWQHPDDPVAKKLSSKIFASKNSPWLPVSFEGHRSFSRLVNTPLLGLPAFRELVERYLDDTGSMGFVLVRKNGEKNIVLKGGSEDDPEWNDLPRHDFRVCDYYAAELANVREFPDFQLTWPLARRNEALAACKTFLVRYGDGYRYRVSPWASFRQIVLPPSDHPATAEDVARGRAIFSLDGETRLGPLRKFPVAAKRPGTKKGSTMVLQSDANGKTTMVTQYETDGMVWQDEEVKIDGKWQRYYGFTGKHQLDRVPADEIEFPAVGNYMPVTPQLDASFDSLPGKDVRMANYNSFVAASPESPLPLVVKVYNHNGLDREVPASLIIPPNTRKTLPAGITLHLTYSEKIPPQIQNAPAGTAGTGFVLGGAPLPVFDYGTWDEVSLRKEIAVADTPAQGPLLQAASELTLLQINLRDYFDIGRPGSYRVQAAFNVPGEPAAKSQEIIFIVPGK